MIPFLDVKAAYDELRAEIDSAVAGVLASGSYIQGPETQAFEEEFAEYCDARHCIGVGNGLDALHLGLKALDVGPGDEVIVASNTFIATWLAVSMVGAKPVPVEPDPKTYNLDPVRIEAAVTSSTKVILPTHLYGQPADLEPILNLAKRCGLKVLEDAAQAHGARYKGRRVGAHGDAVAWSFYPGKNLGAAGDGGAVTTDNPEIADRIRALGNYGSRAKYVHDVRGVNSRLDPLQASILRVKLGHLDSWNARRATVAALYQDKLAEANLVLPHVPDWAEPSWHLFVIEAANREALRSSLAKNGVDTLVHYPCAPHLQAAYADARLPPGRFPLAEGMAQRVLSLPIGPHLGEKNAERVADAVAKALA